MTEPCNDNCPMCGDICAVCSINHLGAACPYSKPETKIAAGDRIGSGQIMLIKTKKDHTCETPPLYSHWLPGTLWLCECGAAYEITYCRDGIRYWGCIDEGTTPND